MSSLTVAPPILPLALATGLTQRAVVTLTDYVIEENLTFIRELEGER